MCALAQSPPRATARCAVKQGLGAEGKGVNLEFSTQPLGREQEFPDPEDTSSWPTWKEAPSGGLRPPRKMNLTTEEWWPGPGGAWGTNANGTGFPQGDEDVLELIHWKSPNCTTLKWLKS